MNATTQGAWGYGLATLSDPGGRVLDTWYPAPRLGAVDAPTAPRRRSPAPTAATSAAACAPPSC